MTRHEMIAPDQIVHLMIILGRLNGNGGRLDPAAIWEDSSTIDDVAYVSIIRPLSRCFSGTYSGWLSRR